VSFTVTDMMHKAGLPIESGWVLEGKLTIEGTIKATRSLLNHLHRPTAIFCANDEMAMGCMHEIRSAGLQIPADMSVVGFDDTRYAQIQSPPLTTVRQPAEEIGERVMYRLLRAIEEGKSPGPEDEIVPHRLIIRQSVAPPSSSGSPG
jgi:LacI family repressor for deo operon, udp, cdd, tsx, nupC, and nupG